MVSCQEFVFAKQIISPVFLLLLYSLHTCWFLFHASELHHLCVHFLSFSFFFEISLLKLLTPPPQKRSGDYLVFISSKELCKRDRSETTQSGHTPNIEVNTYIMLSLVAVVKSTLSESFCLRFMGVLPNFEIFSASYCHVAGKRISIVN